MPFTSSRSPLIHALVVGALATLGAACGSETAGTGSGGGSTAGSGGAGGGDGSWIDGACGVCYADSCAVERDTCAADPGCAISRDCLEACPEAIPDGPPAEDCASACAVPDSSSAQAAYDALQACRTTGPAATCPTCSEDPSQCAPLAEDPTCEVCEKSACCEELTAFRANPEATAILDCQRACGFECESECLAQHPAGVADWGARLACGFEHCSSPDHCGPGPIDACIECQIENCTPQRDACFQDPACYQMYVCIYECEGDPTECFEGCAAAFPDGVALNEAMGTCNEASCLAPCG